MACILRDHTLRLIAVLALTWSSSLPTTAEARYLALQPATLYDRPVLVLDLGFHTSGVASADVDSVGQYAVTGSHDKTVRIWSVRGGQLIRTIRLPAGPGHVGKVYAVAISPKGPLIAVGGYLAEVGGSGRIYMFERDTGQLVKQIDGLPQSVVELSFSAEGRYLAAGLLSGKGLRIYDRERGWGEVARDTSYGGDISDVAFSSDGRLATTSEDGGIRLYSLSFELMISIETTGGRSPAGIAFSPDGSKLAVGYWNSADIDLLDGATLAPLAGPPASDINGGSLSMVAWSTKGDSLFAAGWDEAGSNQIVKWPDDARGGPRRLSTGTDFIRALAPLEDGSLLVAGEGPYLAIVGADGDERWAHRARTVNFSGQAETLAVSADGMTVDFSYTSTESAPTHHDAQNARWDVATPALRLHAPRDGRTVLPKHAGLQVEGWRNTSQPMLNGEPLSLWTGERSHSLAVDSRGDRFVMGARFSLRAYSAEGESLWGNDTPGPVWAVNITPDSRLVVAAYGDGTIRWHRLNGGKELLAFLPLADRANWVAWTPDGFYAATPGAHGVLRWHENRGWDAPADSIPVSAIAELRRPEVLPLVLQQLEIVQALGLAELNKARLATQRRLNSAVKPGTQLHVLAVGVAEYNEQNAKHLRLEFADHDAWDVASALFNTQGSLYAKVNPQVLRNDEATRAGIFRALDTIQKNMQQDDVAVFYFSGHGAFVGQPLYLLPYEVDARDPVGIEGSAIEVGALRKKLLQLAERGRVLVLLDACRSGAVTEDGAETTVDASQLRLALTAANVTVLTSSSGQENSIEHADWQNGAFTQVFLDALGRGADSDRNSVVSMTELTRYITTAVPRLVQEVDPERQQTPGIEMRFEHTIFAAGL